MGLQRREFLRIGATLGTGAALNSSLRRIAFGETPGPILIIVHLRGGCDGLNLVSPANDPAFVAARAAELRVAADGGDAGHALGDSLSPGTDFRLHAAAPQLAEIYASRNLAIVHAAGLTDANRSHFVATDMIEHGVGRTAALAQINTGWITRYLMAGRARGRVSAVGAGNALSSDFGGDRDAVAVPSLDGGFPTPGGGEAAAVLGQLYANRDSAAADAGARTLTAIQEIDTRLRDVQNKIIPYRPGAGAIYDKAGAFGAGLKTLAQLIKMDVGVSVAGVEIGGWDTHEYQAGQFRGCVEQLSRGLGSFWNDLAAYHDRLILVTLSEFGRRLRSNRSGGTDHGRAGIILTLGGSIAGGRLFGRWPGLAPEALDEGVDLTVTTDYRAVLAEILTAHGQRSLPPAVFPEFAHSSTLGLFSAL